VFVPIPTNVYTVYKFFLQDFGYAGAMLAICSIGFLHGIIYRYAKGGSKSGIYFYAITMFPMLMSFFDDTYYNFRGHIRDIIFVILTYSLLPKLIRGARRSLHFRMSKQDTYHLGA
jgi:hypothetical protein